jgi:hypothetical protein
MIGVPPLSPRNPLQGLSNSPFSSFFPMTCLTSHLFFFLVWNEIILFQILYKPLLFSLMKVKIVKLSNMGHVLSMIQNSKKIDILSFFTLQWGILFLSHSYILYISAQKVFVEKTWVKRNCLNIPYESLNFFFLWNKVLDFFSKTW